GELSVTLPLCGCFPVARHPGGIADETAIGVPTRDSQVLLSHWFLRTSEVHLWRGPQHHPEHFNKGAHAVITNRNSCLRYRLALGKHFKRSEQPYLLPPTAKRHTCLSGKSSHESTAGH